MCDRFFEVTDPDRDPRDLTIGSPAPNADAPPAAKAAGTGRRAAHRRATAAAIQAAADKLVAERGFHATTVREIAAAAGVTERTFYRYFDGKEGIVASKLGTWMQAAHAAIIARPVAESPVRAVRMALVQLAAAIEESPERELLWAFTDSAATFNSMRRSGQRPLLRIEQLITDALLERARQAGRADDKPTRAADRFTSELVARTAVAALRTIGAERRRVLDAGAPQPVLMIDRAFDTLQSVFCDQQH